MKDNAWYWLFSPHSQTIAYDMNLDGNWHQAFGHNIEGSVRHDLC